MNTRKGFMQNKLTGEWVPIEYVISEALQLAYDEFMRIAMHINSSLEYKTHLEALAKNSLDTNELVQQYIRELKQQQNPFPLPDITPPSNSNNFSN